ncbi:hypothetical protein C4D60_Mb11t13510 [Musa balbisiana]|nr:hypothetical protein C4D60_Mb11t13510 [Musa balbisiana]
MKRSDPIGFGLTLADRIPSTSPSHEISRRTVLIGHGSILRFTFARRLLYTYDTRPLRVIPLRFRSPPRLLTSASLAATVSVGFSRSPYAFSRMVLPNDVDLLNPPAELEKRRHKLKRLVQSPNSFFMDVKCQGCFNITTVFSHSQTVVVCGNCQTVLCQPTGGRARLTEGCSFRRKGD